MKNLKKLFLVPVLALGTISSCYKKDNNSTTCPEEKKCDVCPSPSNPSDSGSGVSKDGHTLSVDAKEIKVLVDENIGKVKHIVATASPSTDTLSYSSSDTSVAEVSSSGVITGKKANAYCVVTVKSSAGLQIDIAVKTYDTLSYFMYYQNNFVIGIVDRDVEELEFPTTNPLNGTTLTTVSKRFSVNTQGNSFSFPKLKRIVIPEGYTTLEDFAFAGRADNCEYLNFPSTLTTLYGSSLTGLNKLKEITFPEVGSTTLAVSTSEENGAKVLYGTSNNVAYKCFNYPGSGPIFDQGLNITSLSSYCCYNMDSLVDLVIPEGVRICNSLAVFYNKNLKSVSFASTVSDFHGTSSKTFCLTANENLEAIHYAEGVDWINTNYTNKNANGEEANCIVWSNASNNVRAIICATKNMNLDDEFSRPNGTDPQKVSSGDLSAFINVGLNGVLKLPDGFTSLTYNFMFNKDLKGVYIPKTVSSIPAGIPNNTISTTLSPQIQQIYTCMPYNDGELPFYPFNNMYYGSAFSPFLYENEDFTVYYQTRDDGLSIIEKFGVQLGYAHSQIKFKEVADSTLADPIPVDEGNGN